MSHLNNTFWGEVRSIFIIYNVAASMRFVMIIVIANIYELLIMCQGSVLSTFIDHPI